MPDLPLTLPKERGGSGEVDESLAVSIYLPKGGTPAAPMKCYTATAISLSSTTYDVGTYLYESVDHLSEAN